MSIQYRILSFVALFIVFQYANSCQSSLAITRPTEDRKHLTTPTDLVISQTGCQTFGPGVIKAWTDHVDQGQIDLTDKFTYEDYQWTGQDIELPLGTQTFSVDWISFKPVSTCWKGKSTDSRTFTVYEPACIKGTVLGAWDATSPGTPISGANIQVSLTQDGEVVGQAKSSSDGYFCIDTIPLGFRIDIQVTDPTITTITKNGFDPAATGPSSCQHPEACPNVTCRGKFVEW